MIIALESGDQARHGKDGHRLAETAFAGDAQHLACGDVKRHAVQHLHQPAFGAEGDMLVVYKQASSEKPVDSGVIW